MLHPWYFIVTTVLLCVSSSDGDGYSMTCSPPNDDPNQCVRLSRTQKCYRIQNETKCNVTTVSCQGVCCAGWDFDMKAECSMPIRNYICTEPHLNTSSSGSRKYCLDITQCQGDEVCCSNRCTSPVYHDHCWYNNVYHTIGETNTTSNDVCNPCTCKTDGRYGQMTCQKSTCNWDNQTDIPDSYRPPVIHDIPRKGGRMHVYVMGDRNIAYLDISGVYALDFNRQVIPITVSKTVFTHCLCPNKTAVTSIRTDRDMFGNYNETTLEVDIIDKYKPVFHNCPWNQAVYTYNTLSWNEPTVTDNVGVKILQYPIIPKGRNGSLIPGIFDMVYTAMDWSNNTAKCSFRVTILKPTEPHHHQKRDLRLAWIVGGVVSGVLALTLIIVSAITISRRSHTSVQLNDKKRHPQGSCYPSNISYGTVNTSFNNKQ